jgi:hypothetical protein
LKIKQINETTMKTFFATSLLLLMTVLTVKEAVYVTLFQLNRAAIAEAHCENKDITELISERTCQGRCYVQKVIVESTEQAPKDGQSVPTLNLEKVNFILTETHTEIPSTSIHYLSAPQGDLLADSQGASSMHAAPPERV